MTIARASMRVQRPSALDVFTDREPLIAAFMRNLAHKKPEEHRVMVFHGDGGMGKSTLLQKLEQIHRQRCPQALMGRLDLAGADTTPPYLLLYRLSRVFPSIPFPSFSLALAVYGRRFHPEQVFGNDRQDLLQGAGTYADVLDLGLQALDAMSGLATVLKLMKAAADGYKHLTDWVLGRAEPWLQESQSMSEDELLAQLPLQWAKDFRQEIYSHHLEQDDWGDPDTYNNSSPPLITLDTYEILWHAGMGRNGLRREMREQWLVDLVSELPEVLWVIGGRDRLSWEEGYDRGWHAVCEQHLVGQLSDVDAKSFLAKRGIKEPAIVEKILAQAAGVPFYLELQTQLYDRTPADERTPEVFGGSQQKLIDRLLTHLDPSERATLRLLAAFGIWDQKLFRQAVNHFGTGYPANGASELARFWSIEAIGGGRWQLHNEMAHHLEANEQQRDPANFEAVHRWGFAYFDGQLEGLDAKSIQAEDAECLERALSHARNIQPAAQWASWLINRLVQLEKGTIWQPLLAVAERGVQQAEQELGGNASAVAGLLNRQATLLQQFARHEEAEPLFRRALAIDEATYGLDHPELASPLSNLATLLQATNRMEEAELLMRRALRALKIDEDGYGPDHPVVPILLNNLATLLQVTNRLGEAERLMRRALVIDEESHGPNHPNVAIRLNNLAQLLKTNRMEEAERLMRRAIEIEEAIHGSDHPYLASALGNLATLLMDTNRLAEAEQLMRRALAIDEASYNPDHPDIARDLINIAELLKTTNRMAEAEPLMRRALAIEEGCLGSSHPNVARALSILAMLLLDTNRPAEAEPLMRRAVAIDEASFGPDHPNVAIRLNNLARVLQATSRPREAERLMRQALAIDEASYGIDHPKVAIRLDILSRVLHDIGLHEEAENHIRRALAIDESHYVPSHPNIAFDLNSLAKILKATSRLSESDELMRRSLDILQDFNRDGHEHPKWQRYLEDYLGILMAQGLSIADAQAKLRELYQNGSG